MKKERISATVDRATKLAAERIAKAKYRNFSHYMEDLISKDSRRFENSKKQQVAA